MKNQSDIVEKINTTHVNAMVVPSGEIGSRFQAKMSEIIDGAVTRVK